MDNSITGGIGAQFFPHSSSMVSRLNSSASSTSSAPTPTPASLTQVSPELSEMDELQQLLPQFLQANRMSILSLRAVVAHRRTNPPDQQDLSAVITHLLEPFCGLAKVKTGDDNTDAEMRVYCAYSFPAIVLLLGPDNWEGSLKACFMTLVNPNYGAADDTIAPPPLPVKRCLASSLHTVAHILGHVLALSDIMPVFRDHFFRDPDDSVRLNVIRNFSWLLCLLPTNSRSEYLTMWSQSVRGEEILCAFKRSATNPMLLNWRQRDYVARSMPDMLGLVDPFEVQEVLWPVIELLLTDGVNLVREEAMWCIPLLLKVFSGVDDNRRWNTDVCKDIISWLKKNILLGASRGSKDNGKGNFSQRQLYCRICATVGLALRFTDVASGNNDLEEEMRGMDLDFHGNLQLNGRGHEKEQTGPYQVLSSAERTHLRRLLVNNMLPPALEMKDDRVTNVRLTLMKTLQIMPEDVRVVDTVSNVLKQLEDEVNTWESFNNSGKENINNYRVILGGSSKGTTNNESTSAPSVPQRLSTTRSVEGSATDSDASNPAEPGRHSKDSMKHRIAQYEQKNANR